MTAGEMFNRLCSGSFTDCVTAFQATRRSVNVPQRFVYNLNVKLSQVMTSSLIMILFLLS